MNASEEDELSFASSILLNEENDFPSKGHHLNRWYCEYFFKAKVWSGKLHRYFFR
jgi:hypothetical protein